jgi:hypothetical protein
MNKTLILTAVTNSKDNLTNPYVVFDNCDYIAYTDKKYNVKTWEQRSIYEFSHIDNFNHRRNAKIIKVLSTILFPEYEYIVWVDANRQLIINPEMIYNEYGNDFDLNQNMAKLSRQHNDANVISFAARFIEEKDAGELLKIWLSERFSNDERHIRRISKIDNK